MAYTKFMDLDGTMKLRSISPIRNSVQVLDLLKSSYYDAKSFAKIAELTENTEKQIFTFAFAYRRLNNKNIH